MQKLRARKLRMARENEIVEDAEDDDFAWKRHERAT